MMTHRIIRLACTLALCAAPGFSVPAQTPTPEAKRVTTVALQDIIVRPTVSAPARVNSLSDSNLAAELNAVVQAIHTRVGETVEAGALLIELDCRDTILRATELQARLTATEARLKFADQRLARAEALQQRRTLSAEELEQRRSDAASLDAERQAQSAMLAINARQQEKCAVRAPYNAVVLERKVSIGEYVTTGSALLRVLDTQHLEVSSSVLASDTASLEQAKGVVFQYGPDSHPVALRVLLDIIDSTTRTREARLNFVQTADTSSPKSALAPALPGASGRIIWHQRAALPAALLVRRQGDLGVLIADQNRARFQRLPGAQEGRPAPVDLPSWTQIITAGRLGIVDGDLLEITD